MKCKDIESLLIESSGEGLEEKTMLEIKKHLLSCAQCGKLKTDLDSLRGVLMPKPPPLPEDLDQKTYLMCKAELEKPVSDRAKAKIGLGSIPLYMRITLACLLVVMSVWLASLLADFSLGETLSVSTIVVLFFVIQNAVMLVFSPLLLRHFRSKKMDLRVFQ